MERVCAQASSIISISISSIDIINSISISSIRIIGIISIISLSSISSISIISIGLRSGFEGSVEEWVKEYRTLCHVSGLLLLYYIST